MTHLRLLPPILACLIAGCAARPAPARPTETPAPARYRLKVCTQAPVRLPGPPGAQSRGCVATFTQALSDPATIRFARRRQGRRAATWSTRPPTCRRAPRPSCSCSRATPPAPKRRAFYYTHTRFETLADRDGFIVVYGNGLPNPPNAREKPSMPKGGFLQGCLAPTRRRGDRRAVRPPILAQLATELPIDRARVYATGLSAGGGMSFRARARGAGPGRRHRAGGRRSRFSRAGRGCTPATRSRATNASRSRCSPPPTIRSSRTRRAARASTRPRATPAWKRRATPGWPRWGSTGPPDDRQVPRRRSGRLVHAADRPHHQHDRTTALPAGARRSGALVLQSRRDGALRGRTRRRSWSGLWERFGKTNQDIDFADEAWAFFQRHRRGADRTAR